MDSCSLLVLSLSLLTLSYQFLGIKSDEALIRNLCHKTPEPVLDTCSSQFLVAHDSFRGATVALEDQGWRNWRGTAIYELTTQVTPYLNRCLDLFKKQPELPLPNTILVGTNAVNQGIAISLGILKNIPDRLTHS
ncbi:hypothetical protein POTOM_041066 [Populus tomentosa]|uniref:Pectinesterase inhibitor domain-containing protein n=1 Tax=Populus tomentosa TaxID=118781 RepID=A0A8X7YLY0_POPTO|nr:hypothetical protein POTOM_041066 [Populus tomentosa]